MNADNRQRRFLAEEFNANLVSVAGGSREELGLRLGPN
jgi:hypothetical protein